METINFANKPRKDSNLLGIAIIVSTVIILSNLKLSMPYYVAHFLLVSSYFTSTFILSKKVKKLEIEGENITIRFFGFLKKPITTQISQLIYVLDDKQLKIYRKASKSLLGIAFYHNNDGEIERREYLKNLLDKTT